MRGAVMNVRSLQRQLKVINEDSKWKDLAVVVSEALSTKGLWRYLYRMVRNILHLPFQPRVCTKGLHVDRSPPVHREADYRATTAKNKLEV